jgi:amino acid transporter
MRIKPVAIILVVVAIVLAIIGIIYLTQTANHLPGFIPGKPGAKELKLPICNAGKKNRPCYTPRHFTKRGIAALGLAVVALVAAWYTSGLRRPSSQAAAA